MHETKALRIVKFVKQWLKKGKRKCAKKKTPHFKRQTQETNNQNFSYINQLIFRLA